MKRLLLPLLAALALTNAVNAFWKNDLSVNFNGENYSLNKKPTKEKVFTLADYEKSYKSIYNMDNPNFVFNTPSLIEACAKKGLSFMCESELAKCKKKAENFEKGLKYIKHIEILTFLNILSVFLHMLILIEAPQTLPDELRMQPGEVSMNFI